MPSSVGQAPCRDRGSTSTCSMPSFTLPDLSIVHYITVQHTVHSTQYSTVHSTLQYRIHYITVQCRIQYSTGQYIQYSAVQYSTVQYSIVQDAAPVHVVPEDGCPPPRPGGHAQQREHREAAHQVREVEHHSGQPTGGCWRWQQHFTEHNMYYVFACLIKVSQPKFGTFVRETFTEHFNKGKVLVGPFSEDCENYREIPLTPLVSHLLPTQTSPPSSYSRLPPNSLL